MIDNITGGSEHSNIHFLQIHKYLNHTQIWKNINILKETPRLVRFEYLSLV